MKISGNQYIEINVEPNEIIEKTISIICKKFRFPESVYLKDNKLCYIEMEIRPNVDYVNKEIREATEEEIKAVEALRFLYELKNK